MFNNILSYFFGALCTISLFMILRLSVAIFLRNFYDEVSTSALLAWIGYILMTLTFFIMAKFI